MIYNSIILIRGVSKPISVSKENAVSIQKVFENSEIDNNYIFRVAQRSFRKGDIKYIEIGNDQRGSKEWDEEMNNFREEEIKNNLIKRNIPPEDKARNLEMFKFLFNCSCGENPSEEIIKKAHDIQLDFFIKNPKRTICDAYLLKPIIKINDSCKNLFLNSGLRLVEKAIVRDMFLN